MDHFTKYFCFAAGFVVALLVAFALVVSMYGLEDFYQYVQSSTAHE